MSSLFTKCEDDAQAIISVPNGEKQVDLYTREGRLYFKEGGVFVGIMADGGTTKSRYRLLHLSYEGGLAKTKIGRLCAAGTPEAKPLSGDATQKLLGA